MTGAVDHPPLQINRRTPVQRIHLHYEGRSAVENRGDSTPGDVQRSSSDVQRSSSWVDVRRGFLVDPDGVRNAVLADTRWTQGETWRYERYVAEQRLGAMIRSDEQPTAVRQAGLHLRAAYASPLAGVAAILYRDGSDFQGLHSDRSMKWLDNTLIAILVLGERRPFVLRPRRMISKAERLVLQSTEPVDDEDVVLDPGHGDLIVLGGRCQRDWLHGVPACDVTGERISLTWRWSSRTGRPDPGPSYGEGVHYSDASTRPFRRTRRV